MANKFQIKRSAVPGNTPNTTSSSNSSFIDVGELAINVADEILYSSDGSSLITLAGGDTLDDVTTNGSTTTNSITLGGLTVDTNTLHVDATNNRVGIGTASPAYQVEIENTGSNALLVLDRTDGASTFIEGGATDSVIGSVGSNDVKIAYNSIPVVTIGSGGDITTSGTINYGTLNDGTTALTSTVAELNYLDGVTGITLGSANELLVVGGDGSSIVSDSTLAVDTGNNRLGINQSSPEVTLHMTGEGAQTAQIRMEQYNDTADAPDVRTRRYRGTIASPSALQSGDYLFRSNHEYWNGSALIVGGSFAFDNTNNANRTQFAVSVTTDGTSADPNTASKVQFKIDGNDSGAITFNNAYKFPTSDGSADQYLKTDGSGNLSFATIPSGSGSTTVSATAPSSPSEGDFWWDEEIGTLFIYYTDANTSQWVEASPSSNPFSYNSNTDTYSLPGNLTVAGDIDTTSDITLKENIETFSNALEVISQMRGVNFNWIESGKPSIGLIAQEVNEVLPELVGQVDGKMTVQYSNIVAVLIEAVKELTARVQELENK
jgi:hypothetical protein